MAVPIEYTYQTFWSNITDTEVTTSDAVGEGNANSESIIAQDGHSDSAANECLSYIRTYNTPYHAWHLPSDLELKLVMDNFSNIRNLLSWGTPFYSYFMSSTEDPSSPETHFIARRPADAPELGNEYISAAKSAIDVYNIMPIRLVPATKYKKIG